MNSTPPTSGPLIKIYNYSNEKVVSAYQSSKTAITGLTQAIKDFAHDFFLESAVVIGALYFTSTKMAKPFISVAYVGFLTGVIFSEKIKQTDEKIINIIYAQGSLFKRSVSAVAFGIFSLITLPVSFPMMLFYGSASYGRRLTEKSTQIMNDKIRFSEDRTKMKKSPTSEAISSLQYPPLVPRTSIIGGTGSPTTRSPKILPVLPPQLTATNSGSISPLELNPSSRRTSGSNNVDGKTQTLLLT